MTRFDDSHADTTLSFEPAALRGLTPQQKERLGEVLDQYLCALEKGAPPPPEQLLADHPDLAEPLKMYLHSLAQLHDVTAGFGPPTRPSAARSTSAEEEAKCLGDFVLLREIGRGGMGVVYEARQLSLGRRVALKVLPFASVLDSHQIARFKNEAQAAAQLHHPNIVPVYAVGTDRGVHYYAMQFIDGLPLDRVIAELRAKSAHADGDLSLDDTLAYSQRSAATPPEARELGRDSLLAKTFARRPDYFRAAMRLGVQAAEALHAAHDYGVVHRDVKPSNLLLDGEGKLWVTDFGLARCQTDLTLTKTGDVVGTRRYMSPEQASGQAALVDPRSDLYSLGVTFYELLTLQPAFPGDEGPALARQIERRDPIPPRSIDPLIPVDLETVVMKAMSSAREERYASAQEFADDLRRVLEGKPIVARPPSVPDRIGKWVRRHHRVVAAFAVVGLLAMVGLGTATLLITREKVRAERNYRRSEEHFRQAHDAVDRFGAQLADRLADVPGAEQVRRKLLQETLHYYSDFVSQAQDDPELRADLALTFSKIGTLTSEIGSTKEAIAAHESALSLFQQLAAEQPTLPDYRRRTALCKNNLALLLSRSGRTAEARSAYDQAIRIQQALVVEIPKAAAQHQADLALSYNNLGELQSDTGATTDAERSFREAVRLQERLIEAAPGDAELLRNLAASYNNLAALDANDQPARAIEFYQKAAGYQIKAAQVRSGDLKYQSDLALTLNNLGAVQARARQTSAAEASYARAKEIQLGLVNAAPLQRAYRRDLAVSCNNLGLTQSGLGNTEDAEKSFRDALALQESLVAQNPSDPDMQSGLGGIYNNLGIVLEQLNRLDEAAQNYKRAVEYQQAAYAGAATVDRYRSFLSKHCYNYGRVLRQLGRADEAARVALVRKKLWPGDPQHLFSVAEELALASKLLALESHAKIKADECATWALDTLQEAVTAGFELPADLRRSESFAALKDRPQFRKLLKQ